MTQQADIVIVGAGAAGLMAAIFAGRENAARGGSLRIVALDGAKKLGAKILIAGGGRCNVTHDVVTEQDYAGTSRNAIKKVLRSFSVDDTVDFFRGLGVELKREDTGKLFPVTDKARTVLEALTSEAQRVGAELLTEQRVRSVRRDATHGGFVVETSRGDWQATQVLLATGGLALPSTGSDGGGYAIARGLGHTVTPTWPSLVPMVFEGGGEGGEVGAVAHWMLGLSGVALDVVLMLNEVSGKRLHEQAGAMLFTHFGLSGPAVMDMSRHWLERCREGHAGRAVLLANLLPGRTFEQVDARLSEVGSRSPKVSVAGTVRQWLPERLTHGLLANLAGGAVQPGTLMGQLKREQRRALSHALTGLVLPVVGDRGFRFAECTAGGVPLDEVKLETMASRRCEGLSICGELLDCDGRIGGYNFQWAWCSGRLAGIGAVQWPVASGQ